ncbi:MAG: hypothetical protein Q4C47_03695, partial [Planctomycetia bacterium]|nr:hypothetical protein [Planctomycetia bacterium]
RRMALRAYVRVVTLRSERSTAETLSMLRNAFDRTESVDDRALILTRAAEIRSIDTVRWLYQFIEDPVLNQTVCASIAKIAHHRELREPNRPEFQPILEKVEQTTNDATVEEAARKARLGM